MGLTNAFGGRIGRSGVMQALVDSIRLKMSTARALSRSAMMGGDGFMLFGGLSQLAGPTRPK